MDGPALGACAAEPFRGRKPCGVRGTIRIAEFRDGLGGNLDPLRRRIERMALRIAPKVFEQNEVALGRRQLGKALRPKLLKPRQLDALLRRTRPNLIVDPPAPAHLVAAFGEGVLVAKAG